MGVRRRTLLKLAAALPVLPTAVACAGRSADAFFDEKERAALARLCDLVLPPGDGAPGAASLGAVAFIDALLSGEGLVFGSGPFSGRTPFPDAHGAPTGDFPPDDFAVAEPLDRVQREAVRALLFGRGDDPGLRARFRQALAQVGETTTLDDLDPDFVDVLVELVSQGVWGPPEYGGNRDMLGWALVHYEGDQMPFGYTTFDEVRGVAVERADAPVSRADGRLDPDPLDDEVKALLTTAVTLLGGRDTKKPA